MYFFPRVCHQQKNDIGQVTEMENKQEHDTHIFFPSLLVAGTKHRLRGSVLGIVY